MYPCTCANGQTASAHGASISAAAFTTASAWAAAGSSASATLARATPSRNALRALFGNGDGLGNSL